MNSNNMSRLYTFFRLTLILWVPVLVYFIIQNGFQNVLSNPIVLLAIVLGVVAVLTPAIYYLWFKSFIILSEYLAQSKNGDVFTYIKKTKDIKIKDITQFNVVKSVEQILDSFIKMTGKMERASEQLKFYVDNFSNEIESANTAAQQIATSIEEIAKGASEQALAAQETSVNTGSLVGMAEEIDQKTGSGQTIIKNIVLKVEDTKKVLEGLLEHLKLSDEDSINSVENMRNLKDKTSKITGFVSIVAEIAERTNLLALNAAIEAARSGEHGKGFSVVAEEIRKLAEQSTREAEQIKNVAFEIQAEANKTAEVIDRGRDKSKENINRGESSRLFFDEMVNGINELDSLIENIKLLSLNQVSSVRTVLDAAEKMAAVSEQTAASAQEVTASSVQQMESFEIVRDNAKKLYDMSNDLYSISSTLIAKYQMPVDKKEKAEKLKNELVKLSREEFVRKNNLELERKAFKEFAKKFDVSFVGTRDINGEVIYISTEKKVETVIYRQWFQEAWQGRLTVSAPYIVSQNNKLSVNVAAPVKDERDRVIAVISAGMEI